MSVCDSEKDDNLLHADKMLLDGLPIGAHVPAGFVVASEHYALGMRSRRDRTRELEFSPLEGFAVPILGVEHHVGIELAHTSHAGLDLALQVTFVSVGPVISVRMLPMSMQRSSPPEGAIAPGFLPTVVPRHVHACEGVPGNTAERWT